jgi:hypothetical protein
MTPVRRLAFLADRTVVLFMGVGVGAAMAIAFLHGGSPPAAPTPGPAPARLAKATPAAPTVRIGPPDRVAQPVDCAAPFPPRLMEELRTGATVTIGVFGDSFGDGVWAALYHRFAKDPVRVLKLSQEGTGFTRYQVLDLERRAAEQLRDQPVDVAVIVTGANDTEGLFDDDHKHAYALMSPGWKAIYGARLKRFVGLIRGQGAMVYWLGLPKMRQPAYDRDVAALDDFYAEEMANLGVPYLSTRELSADGSGGFNLYLPDPGDHLPRLMRANDGVHMTMAGYERLAGPLIDRIRAYLARAERQAARPVAAAHPPEVPAPEVAHS